MSVIPKVNRKISKIIKPLILITVLLCLCAVGITLLGTFSDLDISSVIGNRLLPMAVLVQIVASFLFVLAWKILLSNQAGLNLGYLETTSHIGVTLLAKYIPGKIWGLVGRGYLLKAHNINFKTSANLLLLDQVLTFSSGLATSILFLSLLYLEIWTLSILFIVIFSLRMLLKMYKRITTLLLDLIHRALRQQFDEIDQVQADIINPNAFYSVFCLYLIHWCATALALSLFIYPLIADNYLTCTLLIIAAIPAAMLSGFIALWAPGGIGVREVVIVAILSLQLPLEAATFIAIAYRLICVVIDLVIGSMSLIYFSRNKLFRLF
ncbi:MAG: hypothetical protein E2O82_03940 [Betaproteobacteria bacterium]|nr:MAG: hypothetical protein E2O82_03940 [Betaproteobacteria bacterium]